MCISFVAVGRSLTIVSYAAFKISALWFWTMFNCNLPIAHCHQLLWGGGILVDHWSTISSYGLMTTYGVLDLGWHLLPMMSCCLTAPNHYRNQRGVLSVRFCETQSVKSMALTYSKSNLLCIVSIYPDNKVHGANMRSICGLSAPDGPHVDPMNLAIMVVLKPEYSGRTRSWHGCRCPDSLHRCVINSHELRHAKCSGSCLPRGRVSTTCLYDFRKKTGRTRSRCIAEE